MTNDNIEEGEMASREDSQADYFNPVICFRHCSEGSNISCFEIPTECPCCKTSLKAANFLVPPFTIPTPFSFTNDNSLASLKLDCSLLIKPTTGNFLTTYKAGDNLHVGITDSRGNIYSYEEGGVVNETYPWKCCLSLEIVSSQSSSVAKIWDKMLLKQINHSHWQKECYDEDKHNCYSFVLEFLNLLLQKTYSKEEFCHRYILPLTTKAADYIAAYRTVLKDGILIH